MLEIPESAVVARQARETLLGKTLTAVQVNASPHKFAFFFGDPTGYPALLIGATFTGGRALGGQVELSAGDLRLVFSDGINLRYFPPQSAVPAKHQLCLGLSDGSHLVSTVQMYGFLAAFHDGENDNPYYLVAQAKPSPLTDAFDEVYFDALWNASPANLSLKAFLATEQRIPGLGNGVLQDILFVARLNPRRKLAEVTEPQRRALFRSLKETLQAMTRGGGRDTEKDLFGNPGGYVTRMSNKTLEQPCPVCGGALTRQAYLGGNVYFCPHCQPIE
jgi:formamidopyrimidine-DNA glycosylase